MTRAAMIENLRSNHIRTLRSLGLPLRVDRRATRCAAPPCRSCPISARPRRPCSPARWWSRRSSGCPGIGRYFVEGALNRDYTLVMGTVVVIAVFVLLFNLVVDILYALIDPRIRYD